MHPVQTSPHPLAESVLSVHRLYKTRYSQDWSYYRDLLLRDAEFILKKGHIKVMTPSELLQDFSSCTYNLSHPGMRRKRKAFLSCLDDIKGDQLRRERIKNEKLSADQGSEHTGGFARAKFEGATKSKSKPDPEIALEDADMYQPLASICKTSAFNAVCPPSRSLRGEKMRCCDIGSSDLPLRSSLKVLPDLALSFDHHSSGKHDVFLHPAVYIEVKADEAFDISFEETRDLFKERKLASPPKQLLLQVLRYVLLGQAPELPWEYLYFTTITGPIARIWKFTRTGCVVTTPIRYLESPEDLIRFTRALALNGRRGLGLSVGEGRLFTEWTNVEQYTKTLSHIANTYANAANNQHWITRRGPSGCWLLKVGSNELFHHAHFTTPETANDYVVFKKPLYCVESMFSRGTRCYLAIAKEDIEDPLYASLSTCEIIAKLRLLKISWQPEVTTSEAEFFRKYDERQSSARPCGIPTLLASGSGDVQQEIKSKNVKPIWIEPEETTGDLQSYARINGLVAMLGEMLESRMDTASTDEQSKSPHMEWLIFKEVGASLSNARDTKELVQVLLDAVDAHESMCNAGILHRDVSFNNILIALNTSSKPRRGLLIDWELAKDMSPDSPVEKASAKGTMRFMSVALNKKPLHQPWHDLESVFWVLFCFTLRHVSGVVFDGELLSDGRQKRVLDSFFNYDDLRSLSAQKKDLLQATTTVKGCPRFSELLEEITDRLQPAYAVFDVLTTIDEKLKLCGTNFRASSNQYQDLEVDVENAHLAAHRSSDFEAIVRWREAEIMRLKADPRIAEKVTMLERQLRRAKLNIEYAKVLDHGFFRLQLKRALDVGEEARCITPPRLDPELDDISSHSA